MAAHPVRHEPTGRIFVAVLGHIAHDVRVEHRQDEIVVVRCPGSLSERAEQRQVGNGLPPHRQHVPGLAASAPVSPFLESELRPHVMGGVVDPAAQPDALTERMTANDLLHQATRCPRAPHVAAHAQVRQRDLMAPLAQGEQRVADDLAAQLGRQQTARCGGFLEHGIRQLPERRAVRVAELNDLVVVGPGSFNPLNPHALRHDTPSSRPATQPSRGALLHPANERPEGFSVPRSWSTPPAPRRATTARRAESDRPDGLRTVSQHENNRTNGV